MRPGTPDIGDPSSRRRPSSLRTSRLQILPIRTRFCPNLGRFAPQISFPDFGRPETRDFACRCVPLECVYTLALRSACKAKALSRPCESQNAGLLSSVRQRQRCDDNCCRKQCKTAWRAHTARCSGERSAETPSERSVPRRALRRDGRRSGAYLRFAASD